MSRKIHPKFSTVILLGLAGVLLLLCLLQSEYLVMPKGLDTAGRLLYRMAFFVVLPFRFIVVFIIPRVDHHWPLSHYVIASLGAPFFLFISAWIARQIYRCGCRICVLKSVRRQGDSIDRRQFLVRSAAGALGFAAGGVGTYASLIAPERLTIAHYEIPVNDLPLKLDGIRLIHVSDTHYGPYTSLTFLEEAIQQAGELDGAVILLTGDYVHFTPRAVEPGIELLAGLRSRFGAVAVLGNHDHWEGAQACRAVFNRIGLPLIDNGRLYLTPDGITNQPREGQSLCLAGVGDMWEDEVSFLKALGGVPQSVPRFLLSHNPDVAELIDHRYRIDLILSGHTHGGQVSLPGIGAPYTPSRHGDKYVAGLCDGPRCPVLVSRGVGLAGIPIRFRVRPELAVVTLKRV